jgi:hypothetical protein
VTTTGTLGAGYDTAHSCDPNEPDGLARSAPRAELLHVLMLPAFDRADRIGEFYGNPKTRTFADLRSTLRNTGTCGRCSWDVAGEGLGSGRALRNESQVAL